MPNGHELPDLPWWQGIGAAAAAAIMYLTGRARGKRIHDESVEHLLSEHEATRQLIRELSDEIRELRNEAIDHRRSDRTAVEALVRHEAAQERALIYAFVKDSLTTQAGIETELARILERITARGAQ